MPAPDARQQLRQLRILHLGLTVSVVIYGVVAFVATPPKDAAFHPPTTILLYVFGFLGASLLLVGAPMARRALGGPSAQQLRTSSIVTWALCESVAIFGLIAAFLFREPLYFLPWGVAALGGMVFFAPRADQVGL